jgi:hypothetical protein
MLRRGVRQTARVETPRRHAVHSGGIQASVLRRYTRVTHGRRNPDARATSPVSSTISFKPLRNCKTPKIVNKLENFQKQKL